MQFTNLSVDPDGRPLMYKWIIDSQEASQEKDYSEKLSAGEHQVRLEVSDNLYTDAFVKGITVDQANLGGYPKRKLGIPIKGINYNIGFHNDTSWDSTLEKRVDASPPPCEEEMDEMLDLMTNELGCNAVRIYGSHEDKILAFAEKCLARNMKAVLLNPNYTTLNIDIDEHARRVVEFAKKAEQLSRPSSLVLMVGNELTIDVAGIIPGTTRADRIKYENDASSSELEKFSQELNRHLKEIVANVKQHFTGPVTYAGGGAWESVDWNALGCDVVGSNDYYGMKMDREYFVRRVSKLKGYGKPVFITEFGASTYAGAYFWGGEGAQKYTDQRYDETEQSRLIMTDIEIFESIKVDAIFLYELLGKLKAPEQSFGILTYRLFGLKEDEIVPHGRKDAFYRYKTYVPTSRP